MRLRYFLILTALLMMLGASLLHFWGMGWGTATVIAPCGILGLGKLGKAW